MAFGERRMEMPQSVSSKLDAAKTTLAHAKSAFPARPNPVVKAQPTPKPAPAAKPAGLDAELKAKSDNVNQYSGAPKMHTGGPIKADGVYSLKQGEHVLSPKEAEQLHDMHHKAKTILKMTSGLKSLHKAGRTMKQPAAPAPAEPDADDKPMAKPEPKPMAKPMMKKPASSITPKPKK